MYLDGDKAVAAVGGDAYAGTVDEMSAQELTSIDELLKTKVGDFEVITSCVSAADVDKQGDNTVYALVIDPDKYAESNEVEKALAEAGLSETIENSKQRDRVMGHVTHASRKGEMGFKTCFALSL